MNSHPTVELDPRLSACPLCESPEIYCYDQTYQKLTVDRCRSCGLKFMNPQCSAGYLENYYANYIVEEHRLDVERMQRRKRDKHAILALIERHTRPGRLLAVGCGDGLEMEIARQSGWQIEGFDVDKSTTEQVAARIGATVYSGDLFQLQLPGESYDCVYLDQVIEHLKNPQNYLREAWRLLTPGGVLYVGCPNIESLSHRVKTITGKFGLRRRRGRHYDMCKHLFYFSPKVLKSLLVAHYGFDVLVAEGAPLSGVKTSGRAVGWLSGAAALLRRKVPALDSSFRLLARKPAHAASLIRMRRSA